jgi:hypothetical protein
MYGIWDVVCGTCGCKEERLLPREGYTCTCGAEMTRQFSKESARSFREFKPYFDEGLGIDINGRNERKQAMKAMGLQEAGDRVGGSRNQETSRLAQTTGTEQPTTGLRLSDVQRRKENPHRPKIGIEKSDGTIQEARWEDLSEPATPKPNAREERRKIAHQIASERGTGE